MRAIWDLCGGGYLSVAEVAARRRLPVGVVRLLLNDLLEQGHSCAGTCPPAPNRRQEILEKVLHGLESPYG